jgi:hypothetical protein
MAAEKVEIILSADGSAFVNGVKLSERQLSTLNKTAKKTSDDFNILNSSMSDISKKFGAEFASSIKLAAGAFVGFASVNFLKDLATDTLETAKTLKSYSEALNISRQSLQEWQFAGERVGLQSEQIADIFKDVSDKIGDFAITGGGAAADMFERFNLKVEEFIGLSPDKAILKMAEAMDKENISQNERVFLWESFGNDLSKLDPLLKDNAERFSELTEQASETWRVLDSADLSALDETNRVLKEVGSTMTGLADQAVAELAKAFLGLRDGFSKTALILEQSVEQIALSFKSFWIELEKLAFSGFAKLAEKAAGVASYIPGVGDEIATSLRNVADGYRGASDAGFQYEKEKDALTQKHIDEWDALVKNNDAWKRNTNEVGKGTAANHNYAGSLKDRETASKEAKKAEEELRKEQDKQINIINKLAKEYERKLNPDKDWDRVDALEGLTGEYLKQGEILYDQNKALEQQIALDAELEAYAIEESKRMDEKLEKQRQLNDLQSQASSDFKQMLVGAISGGGSFSDILGAAGGFMGGSRGENLNFGNLLGGLDWSSIGLDKTTLGAWGTSMDNFITNIGGMANAGSYLGGVSSLVSGSSQGAMQGLGQIAGTFFGGPLGGEIGKYLGGALNKMGIGGSGPYSGKGFAASGSLDNLTLAALTENNKGSKRDVLTDTTFGKWNIEDVLGGQESLGQSQLKTLLQVKTDVNTFRDGLYDTVDKLGQLFGQDILTQFKDSFDMSIDISGENFGEQLQRWFADTYADGLNAATALIDTEQLDAYQKLLFEVGTAYDWNTDALQTAAASLGNLKSTMDLLDVNTGILDSSMITLAGGIDALAASMNFYYNEFMSKEEKAADVTERFTSVMDELGDGLPATREEFKKIVNSADPEKLAKLSKNMQIADSYYDELEGKVETTAVRQVEAYDRATEAQGRYIEELTAGADTLNDWIMEQITGGDSGATFSEQMRIAQAQFNELVSQGSSVNQQDLTGAADTLLRLNREGFGAAGAGLERQVLSQVQGIANSIQPGGQNDAVVALLNELLTETRQANRDNVRSLSKLRPTAARA